MVAKLLAIQWTETSGGGGDDDVASGGDSDARRGSRELGT